MRKLLLSISVLWTVLLSLPAQEAPAAKFEVLVLEGSKEVRFQLKAPSGTKIKVDWGDGNTEELNGSSYLTATHTYNAPLTAMTTVTFDAAEVTSFSDAYGAKGIGGFGEINAPKLKELRHAPYGGESTLKESKNGKIDLSNCPELETLNLRNIPGVVFGNNPKLTSINIGSELDTANSAYASINADVIDLSACKALQTIYISSQNIAKLNIAGLTALKSLTFTYNKSLYMTGLQSLTRGENLTKVEIQGNRLGIDELPLKNPNVTYSAFKINQLDYEIPKKRIKGLRVDLSHIASVKNWEGVAQATTFKWKKGYQEVSTEAYTEQDGIFVFNDKVFEEDEEETVLVVEIETPVFTRTELTGYNYFPYKSTGITLKKNEPVGSASSIALTTTRSIGDSLTFIINANGPVTMEGLSGNFVSGNIVKYELTASDIVISGDLTFFSCRDNGITALKAENTANLKELRCQDNQIETLDLTGLSNLTLVKCHDNALTSLILEGCVSLAQLECGSNKLARLEVKPCTQLRVLHCEKNALSALDIDELQELKSIRCHSNQLGALDVSKAPAVNYIECYNNKIKGESMTSLVNGLADLQDATVAGWFFVVDKSLPNDENICLKSDVAIALGKKWRVLDNNGGGVPIIYPGRSTTAKISFSIGDRIKAEDFSATVEGKEYGSGQEVEIGKTIVFKLKEVKNEDGTPRYSDVKWTVDGKIVAEGFEYMHEVKADASLTLAATVGTEGIINEDLTFSVLNDGGVLIVKGLAASEKVQIFDLTGRLLIDTSEHSIDTTLLPRGIYIICVEKKTFKVAI